MTPFELNTSIKYQNNFALSLLKNPKFNSKCFKKCLMKMQVKFKHDGHKEKI